MPETTPSREAHRRTAASLQLRPQRIELIEIPKHVQQKRPVCSQEWWTT